MADSREAFIADTDAAIQAEPLTVALSLLNNTPGTVNGRGSTYIFRAVGDIEVTDSVELSTEPGVMGRIGPKFPRSASFRVRVHDNPTTKVDPKSGLFTPESARAQHNLLRNLVGTLMYIDARAAPPERIIWTIENVKAVDDNSAKNAYDVDVSAKEILGGEFGEFIDPNELLTGQEKVPVQIDEEAPVLGIRSATCSSASTTVVKNKNVSSEESGASLGAWKGYFLRQFLGPWASVERGKGMSQFLNTLPGSSFITSVEAVDRPNMHGQSYACMDLTTASGPMTFSFESMSASGAFDVGIHGAGDSDEPPQIIGTPPAPIFYPNPDLSHNLWAPTMIVIFIGTPWDEEAAENGSLGRAGIGRRMVIIRGNFT